MGLVGPDEPRYAWIARDMAESGDWVTPRLYGKPWFEKPPLYYWGAAVSFKIFGVSEVTARMPSAVCALLATLAMAWLAWRVYGAETARWVLLLLPTTAGMIGFSHAAATDMPFAAMLTIAMVLAASLLNLIPSPTTPQDVPCGFFSFTSSTSLTRFFFGFFLGVATLAKGPAALILAGGGVLFWVILTKRRRDAFRCLHPVAIASFCFTALPWYVLCARRNPDFFRVFIIEHNFKRFFTTEFQHVQPFWFYIPVLMAAFAPWTLLPIFAGYFGASKLRQGGSLLPATTLLCCWSLFCVLFFSVSKSKLPGYILPAIPAIGVLLGCSLTGLTPPFTKSFRRLLGLFAVGLAATAILIFVYPGQTHTPPTTAGAARVVALSLLCFALANWLLAAYRSSSAGDFPLSSFCVLPILGMAILLPSLLPNIFPFDPSGKTLASEIAAKQLSSDLFIGPMSRGQYFSLNFYLRRELKTWDSENPEPGYLLMHSKACKSLVKAPWSCGDKPIELPKSGWFAYRVGRNDSVSGLGGTAGSGRSAGSNLDYREPR